MFKNWQDKLKLLNEPKWPNRITFYILFFACVSLAFILPIMLMSAFFPGYSFLHNGMNPDNARYMLSALIQSLAAVVAIVVTLSLVAIQLSAQSYSSRVIDVYRKTPDIWILISIYTTNIFFGLSTIKIIGTNFLPTNGLFSLEFFIFVAYFLGFFAFICLIPYIWNTLALLNPSTVIKLLAEDITEESLLKTFNEEENTFDENSPLLPIIDIITSSIMKYDHATVRSGAKAIVTKVDGIINKNNDKKISQHVCKHLERVSILALKREDEECTEILIISLEKIGRKATESKLETATYSAVVALRKIGEKAAENKLETATNSVVKALHKLGLKAAESKLEEVTEYAVLTLREIGLKVAENKLEIATLSAVWALRRIGRKTAENKLEDPTKYAVMALGEIGEKAAENKLKKATSSALISLHKIWGMETKNELNISEEAYQAIEKIKQKQNKSDLN